MPPVESTCPGLQPPQQQHQPQAQAQAQAQTTPPAATAATAATLLLILAVLCLASWLTNRRFGHATYHRGAPIEDGDEGKEEFETAPPHRPPRPRASGGGKGRPLLQESLPQELLAHQILPFLTPFDVVTGPALCSRACWAAAEAPGLWVHFARRARLGELLLAIAAAAAAERRELEREGGEEVEAEEGGQQQQQQQQKQPDAGEGKGRPAPLLGEVKGKLEFFRRAFLLPYALTKGHGSPASCRVVVHGAAYDVTAYLGAHPGGEAIMLEYGGGLDATTVFELALHSGQARRKMREFLLWDPASPSCLGRRGTILGLIYAAATGGRGLGANANSSSGGGGASSPGVVGRATPSPPLPVGGTGGGILRANDARSPPTIVHTLEAVDFGS